MKALRDARDKYRDEEAEEYETKIKAEEAKMQQQLLVMERKEHDAEEQNEHLQKQAAQLMRRLSSTEVYPVRLEPFVQLRDGRSLLRRISHLLKTARA